MTRLFFAFHPKAALRAKMEEGGTSNDIKELLCAPFLLEHTEWASANFSPSEKLIKAKIAFILYLTDTVEGFDSDAGKALSNLLGSPPISSSSIDRWWDVMHYAETGITTDILERAELEDVLNIAKTESDLINAWLNRQIEDKRI
jgi:hypothetical protein